MAAFRSLGVTGLALGAGLLLSAVASAQDHAPPAAVGQTAPLPAGVPTPAPTSTIPIRPASELDRFDGSASGAPSPAAEEPFPPELLDEVRDPMLEPVPRADRELLRWQEALAMTRRRSTNLRTAYAQVGVAQGQARQALASALPTLIANSSINHHLLRGDGLDIGTFTFRRIPDPPTTWNNSVEARLPLFAPRAWWDRRTAELAVRAAELDAKEVERQVIGGLAEAIVAVITAERMAEVSRVNLRFALSTYELNRRRERLGAANMVDVLRAEQEVLRSRTQVVNTDEAVRRAREALGLALGYDTPWGVTPEIRLDRLRADAAATCRQGRTIGERPDVQAADAGLLLAERNVTSIDFSYLPQVQAQSTVTYFTVPKFAANQDHVTWTVGGLLTWHLYDGGLRYAQRATNEGQRDAAEQRALQVRRDATIQVRQAYRNVQVAKTQLEVSQQTRDAARRFARLSRIKFESGTGTSFDLVDALRSLREAELDVTLREFELLQAEIGALLALATCDGSGRSAP
jgi:outer membrane protein TolC